MVEEDQPLKVTRVIDFPVVAHWMAPLDKDKATS